MLATGHHELEPGKIASVVTYLEMLARPDWLNEPAQGELRLFTAPSLDWYRNIFRAIGQNWLWFSRLALSDDGLRAKLDRPGAELYVFSVRGEPAGLVELEIGAGSVEIVFFGLLPAFTGKGHGRSMMALALQCAWAVGIERVWLHTCTLDDPAALPFYRRRGFVAYKRAIEVADDPRLTGLLPKDAAPQVPIL